MSITLILRALANERRLQVLRWLKDPHAHFRPQVDGGLGEDGVCAVLLAEKLGIGQPTLSEHMKILSQAGLVQAKRIKQWTATRSRSKRSRRRSRRRCDRRCVPT